MTTADNVLLESARERKLLSFILKIVYSNNMKNQLVSYLQCQQIVAKNDNFYEKVEIKEGYKISIFNYILPVYDWFKTPFEGATCSAFEMRGLTFIHTENGPIRFLHLHKFFNINENTDSQVENLKHLKIIRVDEKLDGSMIRAIILPNNKILCKTKVGFTNIQSKIANDCVIKQELTEFIKETSNLRIAAIFELCSPFNKIVVDYKETELRLIQMRDEETGLYLDIYSHPLVLKHNPKIVYRHPVMTFGDLLNKQSTEEGKEGYIVTLENGQMNKFKTKWYFDRHKLINNASYENNLVKMICEETLDDAISLLDKDNQQRLYAEEMQLFLLGHIRDLVVQAVELSKKNDGDQKKFAIENQSNPMFSITTKALKREPDGDDLQSFILKAVKSQVANNCRRLEMARSYLNKHGFKVKFQKIGDE